MYKNLNDLTGLLEKPAFKLLIYLYKYYIKMYMYYVMDCHDCQTFNDIIIFFTAMPFPWYICH